MRMVGDSARAHVRTSFDVWGAAASIFSCSYGEGPISQVICEVMMGAFARAHAHAPFSYHRNDLVDWLQNRCGQGPIIQPISEVTDGQ